MRIFTFRTMLSVAAGMAMLLAQAASAQVVTGITQTAATTTDGAEKSAGSSEKTFLVDIGTHIPLSMVNSVSTKHSQPGDRVYLETTFPI